MRGNKDEDNQEQKMKNDGGVESIAGVKIEKHKKRKVKSELNSEQFSLKERLD